MHYISHIPGELEALPFPRRIALMGCTGSIGCSTLRVLESWKDSGKFHVEVLAAGRNIQRLAEQAAAWRPPYLAVQDAEGPSGIEALRTLLHDVAPGYEPYISAGQAAYAELAALPTVDMVLSAQVGAAGLRATAAAAAAGKTICLANKESLVLAGSLIRALCERTGAVILPVDSEHFALFEGMVGRRESEIAKLVLTASGGPFRTKDADFIRNVTPEDALRHPNWAMGAKITIDSATLMNKGLEVIEACHLYQMSVDDVEVVVHPQSIVHSLVELVDGAMMGHFAVPDMRVPIAGCLSWPYLLDNKVTGVKALDLAKSSQLTFEEPRRELFPCLDLARRAFAEKRTVELNAANEVAVARFLAREIGFMDIPALVASVVDEAAPLPDVVLGDDLAASVEAALIEIENRDAAARAKAEAWHPAS
ncbi:MAG: 1-deoxy-D-xylulose-5-phosphate reductoisomerase [Mailhella sp.]|nr:1-deoxy-D-xylulose-5-phosphate reductoisomerase [Mailhella sp.]